MHLLLANLGPVELIIILVVLGIPLVAVVGLVVWLVLTAAGGEVSETDETGPDSAGTGL